MVFMFMIDENYEKDIPNGFTLIELLLVVGVIGVLAGVSISIINVSKQKTSARDSIRLANLEKLISGIESYGSAEGTYPSDTDTPDDHNFKNEIVAEEPISFYLKQWPDGVNDDGVIDEVNYGYKYGKDANGNAALLVPISKDKDQTNIPTTMYKYNSVWGKIQTCKWDGINNLYDTVCNN